MATARAGGLGEKVGAPPHRWGVLGQIPPGAGFPDPQVVGAGGVVSSGTSFLMNSVLHVDFMLAYVVALFCFMLVLCSTRGLPCPGRSWGQHKASLQLV